MPAIYSFYRQKGTDRMMSAHPIHDFVEKYKGLLRKGYTQYKAFQIVEEELRELLED